MEPLDLSPLTVEEQLRTNHHLVSPSVLRSLSALHLNMSLASPARPDRLFPLSSQRSSKTDGKHYQLESPLSQRSLTAESLVSGRFSSSSSASPFLGHGQLGYSRSSSYLSQGILSTQSRSSSDLRVSRTQYQDVVGQAAITALEIRQTLESTKQKERDLECCIGELDLRLSRLKVMASGVHRAHSLRIAEPARKPSLYRSSRNGREEDQDNEEDANQLTVTPRAHCPRPFTSEPRFHSSQPVDIINWLEDQCDCDWTTTSALTPACGGDDQVGISRPLSLPVAEPSLESDFWFSEYGSPIFTSGRYPPSALRYHPVKSAMTAEEFSAWLNKQEATWC